MLNEWFKYDSWDLRDVDSIRDLNSSKLSFWKRIFHKCLIRVCLAENNIFRFWYVSRTPNIPLSIGSITASIEWERDLITVGYVAWLPSRRDDRRDQSLLYSASVICCNRYDILSHRISEISKRNQHDVATSLRNRNVPEYVGLVRIKVNNSTLTAFLLLVRLVGSTNLEAAAWTDISSLFCRECSTYEDEHQT